MSLCLLPEEIEDLTRRQRYSAQLRVLRALGIESRCRPDGTVLVDRSHYEEWARGSIGGKQRQAQQKTEPRWDA